MTAETPYVVETLEAFSPDTVFNDQRDQVVLAVRITPVYGQLELGLLASVVDEANTRGVSLAREQPFRDEWLLCVFEGYEDDGS
jgi:hypothetical protein